MTKTTTKITATVADSKLDILIMGAGDKFYAMCSYPVQRTVKAHGNPYAPGKAMLPARTANVGSTDAALKEMLDLLEKKMGTRPVVNAK